MKTMTFEEFIKRAVDFVDEGEGESIEVVTRAAMLMLSAPKPVKVMVALALSVREANRRGVRVGMPKGKERACKCEDPLCIFWVLSHQEVAATMEDEEQAEAEVKKVIEKMKIEG